jgi:hypothetical protein
MFRTLIEHGRSRLRCHVGKCFARVSTRPSGIDHQRGGGVRDGDVVKQQDLNERASVEAAKPDKLSPRRPPSQRTTMPSWPRFSPGLYIATETFLGHVHLEKAGDGVSPPAGRGVTALERFMTFIDVVLRTHRRRRLVILGARLRLIGHSHSLRVHSDLNLGIVWQPGDNRAAKGLAKKCTERVAEVPTVSSSRQ